MKIVVVEWLDSGGIVDMWSFKDEELPTVRVCSTVGYLVSKNRLEVVLAQSENEEQWGRLITIPSKSVTKLKYFEEKIMKTVRDILESCAEDYYPYHEYSGAYEDKNKESLDQALKELEALLLECKPEKEYMGEPGSYAYNVGYNEALDDYEKNIKKVIGGKDV